MLLARDRLANFIQKNMLGGYIMLALDRLANFRRTFRVGISVVEPVPPFLVGAVKKGAATAPAHQLKLQLGPYVERKEINKKINNNAK